MFKCWFILENRRSEKKSNSSFVNISIEKSSQSTRVSSFFHLHLVSWPNRYEMFDSISLIWRWWDYWAIDLNVDGHVNRTRRRKRKREKRLRFSLYVAVNQVIFSFVLTRTTKVRWAERTRKTSNCHCRCFCKLSWFLLNDRVTSE